MTDSTATDDVPTVNALLDGAQVSDFVRTLGLHVDEAGRALVMGWFEAGPQHHQPFGIIHGGVYSSVVETCASLGAWLAVRDKGLMAVGVSNTTDFLRPASAGRMTVTARALHQGRTQQLWGVTISRASDGKDMALGRVRLQNIPAPS
jgi:1,4-dihydroxy-2-naphthoyl-CoA hydrolase